MEMIDTLPAFLHRNGFDYECIKSGAKAFIYLQRYSKFGGIEIVYYEVFKKVIAKECTLGGNFIPEHIAFPGNEAFGNWAWTFRDKDKAIARFNQLENAS